MEQLHGTLVDSSAIDHVEMKLPVQFWGPDAASVSHLTRLCCTEKNSVGLAYH